MRSCGALIEYKERRIPTYHLHLRIHYHPRLHSNTRHSRLFRHQAGLSISLEQDKKLNHSKHDIATYCAGKGWEEFLYDILFNVIFVK